MTLAPPTDPTWETLVANDQIRDLLSSYCYLLDAGDFASVAQLFVADEGYLDGGVVGLQRGQDAIASVFARLTADNDTSWMHLTGNVRITHGAADHARVESCFIGAQQQPGQTVEVGAAGRYLDVVTRVEGVWKFASRTICLDLVDL